MEYACACGWRKAYATNLIARMGALKLFWGVNFNRLTIGCCNCIIGLSLGESKTFVINEIAQIGALNSF
jgi:hypothetical protein